MAGAIGRTEVLSEGWLYCLHKKQKVKETKWKKFFYILKIKGTGICIELYKKTPKSTDKSKISHEYFQLPLLHKINDPGLKDHPYLCDVTDPTTQAQNAYAFDKESRRDSLAFFLSTQRSLPEVLSTGHLFPVEPDPSDAHRKIGSRGSKCVLHICLSGLTLAFRSSHCIIAQWPLNSIRNFEVTNKGHFSFEGGRRAPMGEGVYGFVTASGDDAKLYALLDKYIAETLKSRSAHHDRTEKIYEEYCSLRTIALRQSDVRFTQHLKRASESCFHYSTVTLEGDNDDATDSGTLLSSDQMIANVDSFVEKMSTRTKPLRVKSNTEVTEDPLSMPSYDDAAYMDMSRSTLHLGPDRKARDLKSEFSLPMDESLASPDVNSGSLKSPLVSTQSYILNKRMGSITSFSPLSMGMSPPPTFYEACALPSYPAPTLPSSVSQAASRPRSISASKLATHRSAGSCEDLTNFVRDSLVLSPTKEWHDYENALFSNDLMHDKESSTEVVLRRKDSDLRLKETDAYMDDNEELNSDTSSSRVTSTYLVAKGEPPLPPKLANGLKVDVNGSHYKHNKPLLASPYSVTDIDSASSNVSDSHNIFFLSLKSPPKVPSSPRPQFLKMRAHTVDVCENVKTQNHPTRLSKHCYESIDLPLLPKHDSLADNAHRMSTVYEPINEREMLKRNEIKEPTTVWHVTLDGDVIDNPVPEIDLDSDTVDASGISIADNPNQTDNGLYYMAPSLTPEQRAMHEIRLPLPPENQSSDEEESRTSIWSFGSTIRKKLSELNRGKIVRSKSIDVLDTTDNKRPSRSSQQSSCKSQSSDQQGVRSHHLFSKKSNSSSKQVNEEFCFVRGDSVSKDQA